MSLKSVLGKIMEQILMEVTSRCIQYKVVIQDSQNSLTKDKLCLTTLVASCDGGTTTAIQGRLTNIIYLIFCKVLDIFPHATFVSKLERDGIEGWMKFWWMISSLGAFRQRRTQKMIRV